MNEEERQRRFRDADEMNTSRRASILGANYRDMRSEENTTPLVQGDMDIDEMYKYRMVPLHVDDRENNSAYGITLATPESQLKEINKIAAETAKNVQYYLISDSAFRALMKRYDPPKEVIYHDVKISDEGDSDTIDQVSKVLENIRADDILNYLITQADGLGASDIHLENQRSGVRVRFRIDGTLHPIAVLSHEKYRILFSSIASAANLSTASTESQSGHIVREIGELTKDFKTIGSRGVLAPNIADKINKSDDFRHSNNNTNNEGELDLTKKRADLNDRIEEIENLENDDFSDPIDSHHTLNMRIETVPTSYGQDAVIRLFNFRADMLQMDVLGLSHDEREQLEEIISHPRGMVMVVGPTGSGKSTTLYSILNALNEPTRKLLTLEDPVEFDIPGVSQIPVDTTHGQTFADNVRTILRLDPDVVMVGEIRDEDTARTAIQAAITGHLLLATFHAQDAAAAFARMIDMIGVNPVFATAIRLVIGQRLVRRLDDATKIEYKPSEAEKKYIRGILKEVDAKAIAKELGDNFDQDNFKLWKPGISKDDPFGYKGRVVLMEQLIVSDEIAKFLRGDAAEVSAVEIEKSAKKEGMITMLQKGIFKVLLGETTLEEINRVL